MITELVQAALTVLFGSLAGGITNSVAIWMLFHPYHPPALSGRRLTFLQGAIPKNKARLAAAIGRTVGTKLLTPEDLARAVDQPAFREAFDNQLQRFLADLLNRERGSLMEELPAALAVELRALLDDAAAALLVRFDAYLASDEFRDAARRWAERLADELRDQPLGDLLTPEREAAFAAAAERWIEELVTGQEFENAVHDYLDRTAEKLLQPERTFQDLVPAGLVSAVERAIAGYLPIALERLGGLLEDPAARDRVERILHELFDRFMKDLRFHQRLVASLLITPDTIDRVILAIQAEGANKISELLHDPAVRDAMARGVNDAIVDFLRRPVTSVLGRAGDPTVEEAKETIAGWGLSLARDPQTRAFIVEKLQATLRSAERRTWGDLFGRVPPDRIADAITAAARSEHARAVYKDAAARLITTILEIPIGRLTDVLPPDAAARIQAAVADPLWTWIHEQIPPIAQRVDIARRVETKILDYPLDQLEALIRGVTERELRLIVRLGYVLGAMIGLISALLNLIMR